MYLDLYQAIEQRQLVQMYYGDYFRVIEPRVYGRGVDGTDMLEAYQIGGCDAFGRHNGWKWFRAAGMDSVRVLSTHFAAHRTKSRPHYRNLQNIYCQVAMPNGGDVAGRGAHSHRRR